MKQRKVPLRKCTGCQEMKNKKELIRIVRNDAGEFALDRTGKLPGRGAYICPNAECLAKAQKSKGLEPVSGEQLRRSTGYDAGR